MFLKWLLLTGVLISPCFGGNLGETIHEWWHGGSKTTTNRPPVATTTTATTTASITETLAPVDIKYPISQETRVKLRQAMRGVTPEQRKKRLSSLGKKVKIPRLNKTRSQAVQSTIPKVNLTPVIEPDLFEVNRRAGLHEYLFQGDMNLEESQLDSFEESLGNDPSGRKKRQILNEANLWTDNTVYFYFDTDVSSRVQTSVAAAHKYISDRTCVKFVQDATQANRVKVINGAGCLSSVGMVGGEQTLSLGAGCEQVGIAAHEFSHTLGAFHAQMRYDRDSYVTVDLTDVQPGTESNFVKYDSSTSTNVVPYELASFMHYPAMSFVSSGGKPSIVPLDGSMIYTMGNRAITFYDMQMVNTHYSCKCPENGLICANGGYPNPNDCSKCNCPIGYGGDLCNERPKTGTCGATLMATANWQEVSYKYGDDSNSGAARDDFDLCIHWIQAPFGKQIQFQIMSSYNPQCTYGCLFNGIEPKINADQKMTNTKYCCDEFNNKVLSSEVNPMPVVAYNRYYYTTYTWQYRYVDAANPPTMPPSAIGDTVPKCFNLVSDFTCDSYKGSACYDGRVTDANKVQCATTFDICDKNWMVRKPCFDYYSSCLQYSIQGRCKSDLPLVSEYNCPVTCGYCTKPNK
ncbi:unnamed protein product [Caenorhabditis auriculariae]|uniref:Zinc metalloproteinase n=1 Tax=Caenorhabditis auriculariae TaxID=2777116 RepID=A0A8S1HXA2_9PELO|nr:unnamed protein product [Caenorhabditis auriculariae]